LFSKYDSARSSHQKLTNLHGLHLSKELVVEKILGEVYHNPFRHQRLIAVKILRVTSPQVRKVGTGQYQVAGLEWMHMVANEPGTRSFQYNKQLKLRMKMPVRIKMRSRQVV